MSKTSETVENKHKNFAKHRYRVKLASNANTFSKQTVNKGLSRRRTTRTAALTTDSIHLSTVYCKVISRRELSLLENFSLHICRYTSISYC